MHRSMSRENCYCPTTAGMPASKMMQLVPQPRPLAKEAPYPFLTIRHNPLILPHPSAYPSSTTPRHISHALAAL